MQQAHPPLCFSCGGCIWLQCRLGQHQERAEHTQRQNPPLQRAKAGLLTYRVGVIEGKAFPGELECGVTAQLASDQVLQGCDGAIQRKQVDDTIGDNLGQPRVGNEGGLVLPQRRNVVRQPTAALHNNDGPALPDTP